MIRRIVLTLLFVLVVGTLSKSQDRHSADFETIEGTWILVLNAPPAAPAELLTTFARGGAIVANGNNAQPVLRSAWQGVWMRKAYFDFVSTWRRWNFDASGAFIGANEFRMNINVDGSLESLSGTVEVLTLDRAGNVTASRPGTFTASRVLVREPNF
jgi:hypothetical protein